MKYEIMKFADIFGLEAALHLTPSMFRLCGRNDLKRVGMGRIHYPADYPAGYPVSGGKIGRIAEYHFGFIIKLSKVKWKYAEIFIVKIF